MLTRFQNIFKVGKVHNCGENKYGTEIFRFSTARFEHVQFIIACMWPWLGWNKQCQIKQALQKYHAYPVQWVVKKKN